MVDPTRELTLYIQSKKAVTSFYRPPAPATGPTIGGLSTQTAVMGAASGLSEARASADEGPVFFLSDDQSRAVALVEDLAQRRGYTLKVVDVEKAGRLERLVTEHLRGVTTFPVLVSPSGQRLVGVDQFTDENVAALMPTELKTVRALSYLKVKGGDLEHIRRLLEGLSEVKELHFLTGDWDMLVVLEFPPTAANKRREVLDFVTDRIRGIPEILDTSTLVPEFSVSKFP
jgi:DNA-binding Lrp family transcriptional regulator